MTPQTFTLPYRAGRTIRWTIARAVLLLWAGAMKITVRLLLCPEHPTRVFVEGRLAESMPAVSSSLAISPRCAALAEKLVGASALGTVWYAIDGLLVWDVGPLDLIPLLLPGV